MRSYSKPTTEQLERAIQLLGSPQHEAYFFSQLKNPEWIGPLVDRGFFKHPPRTEQVDGGGIRYPAWPAGRYLVRMAATVPAKVANILASVETENPSVIGDVIEAAMVMPPDDAILLIPTVAQASKADRLWIYADKAADFCLRLADGGHSGEALTLAKALFAPRFENGEDQDHADRYWYKEHMKKVVPVLAVREPQQFLPTLCDWLDACINAKGKVGSDADYSYLWRPAVEEHDQNPDYDFAGVMVGFVREGFEQAIRAGKLSVVQGLSILQPYSQVIYRRIRLHLIGEFADQNPELARQEILNRELFDAFQYKHEYATLVGLGLGLLSHEQREEWYSWIDCGPDMSNFDQSWKTLGHGAPTEENRREWIQDWQFGKLYWARTHLKGARLAFYDRLVVQRGEPALGDLNVHVTAGFRGDESPMTLENLAAMTFEQVVDKVSAWRPSRSQFLAPNLTGLGLTFEQYVSTKAEEVSSKSRMLAYRPAIFVHGFIRQMTESVKAGRDIDTLAVLSLCDWVLTRPVNECTVSEDAYDRSMDKDWQWTRDEISRFVESICTAKVDGGPRFALDVYREPMWRLISSLYHDKADSYILFDGSAQDPRVRDFLTLAINSPRGKAVEAALEYARWVANHLKITEGKEETIAGGFGVMPEVREMLEWQIAPENRTVEALAMIGSRIALLYWIDREWLVRNADRLFRLQDIERDSAAMQGWAAWNAFLVWVRPHIEFYRIFKAQFAYAVEQAASATLVERNREQPMYGLGQHLMIIYGRGQLALDPKDSVLRRFLDNANPDVRRHAIEFIGRTLQGDQKVPSEFIERCQALWDDYWPSRGWKDAEAAGGERLFGTWFSSGKFPASWAIERLEQFVKVRPTPEPDHVIAEKLAEIAEVDLVKAVRIIEQMVRGDREGWRIQGFRDSAKQILHMAVKALGDPHDAAVNLINTLGRRGYVDFGQLLT